MKKLLILPVLFLALACGEESTESHNHDHADHAEATTKMSQEERVNKIMAGIIDPVCDMEYDPSTWTDSTVYNGNTLHFCSSTCKNVFEGNSEKYLQ